ncbi:MAG: FxsA family protein [Parashewanella sp.]
MLLVLLAIFVVLPILELTLMIHVGTVLGAWNTVALVVFTAVVGGSLVRSQGIEKLKSMREKVALGEAPGLDIIESMMLAMAGIMLVLPGFITDFIGLLFLTPLTRRPIAEYFFKRMQVNMTMKGQFHQSGNPFSQQGSTFEGDFENKSEPEKEVNPNNRLDDK